MTDGHAAAIDPVCGMTVETAHARETALISENQGHTHYFCGRGSKLEFEQDPMKFLDQSSEPSMEL